MALDHHQVHVRLEKLEVIAPVFLGVVHRSVGTFNQRIHILPIVRVNADADADGDVQFELTDAVRYSECGEYFLGAERGVGSVLDVGQQDDELIAALAADRIRTAHGTAQALRYRYQQLVTDAMPHRIVDVFKTIQIEEHQRQLFALALRERHRLHQPVVEQNPVRQAGQRVVLRQIRHLHFGLLNFFGQFMRRYCCDYQVFIGLLQLQRMVVECGFFQLQSRFRHAQAGFCNAQLLHRLFQHLTVALRFLVQQLHFQQVMDARQHFGQIKRFADEIACA